MTDEERRKENKRRYKKQKLSICLVQLLVILCVIGYVAIVLGFTYIIGASDLPLWIKLFLLK